MGRRIHLAQGSADWELWRVRGIGSSDAPIIMGVSPWTTPFELYLYKTGLRERPDKEIFWKGREMEIIARRVYEEQFNEMVQPACFIHEEHDWMKASVDGITFDGNLIIEIKYANSCDHLGAAEGRVPEKYIPQIQHQLYVTGAELCHYFSFDGQTALKVDVAPDAEYFQRLLHAEIAFMNCLQNQDVPKLSERDVLVRNDLEFKEAVFNWMIARHESEIARQRLQLAEDALLSLCDHPKTEGFGVRCTVGARKGAIDYQTVPELKGIDLEKFRKPPVTYKKIEMLEKSELDEMPF